MNDSAAQQHTDTTVTSDALATIGVGHIHPAALAILPKDIIRCRERLVQLRNERRDLRPERLQGSLVWVRGKGANSDEFRVVFTPLPGESNEDCAKRLQADQVRLNRGYKQERADIRAEETAARRALDAKVIETLADKGFDWLNVEIATEQVTLDRAAGALAEHETIIEALQGRVKLLTTHLTELSRKSVSTGQIDAARSKLAEIKTQLKTVLDVGKPLVEARDAACANLEQVQQGRSLVLCRLRDERMEVEGWPATVCRNCDGPIPLPEQTNEYCSLACETAWRRDGEDRARYDLRGQCVRCGRHYTGIDPIELDAIEAEGLAVDGLVNICSLTCWKSLPLSPERLANPPDFPGTTNTSNNNNSNNSFSKHVTVSSRGPLPGKKMKVLTALTTEPQTFHEIAAQVGVSSEYARQVLNSAPQAERSGTGTSTDPYRYSLVAR